jgi:hypothetical protein
MFTVRYKKRYPIHYVEVQEQYYEDLTFKAVLRIHDILVWIRIHDPCLGLMDPDPSIFIIDLQYGNKNE